MARSVRELLSGTSGAVAPTVALSLFALIAAGGIAWDYSRLATMDSELQSAADQAALAAASQLDGEANTCERAVAAAQNMVANQTRFANDADPSGRAITIANPGVCNADATISFSATASVRFYQDKAKATPSTNDSNAKFVEVDVVPRTAFYSLTPVVGAVSSGAIRATAFAGLGEAYCKTPPVMICNPQETAGSTAFNPALLVGKGLKLVSVGAGGGWAPGNFGYLDTGDGSNGAPGLREALGWTTPPGNCVSADGVDTKPGATVTVTDSINTRFDIYQNGNVSCPAGGTCPASINSVKDLMRPANANGGNACKVHNQGWQIPTGYYGSGSIPNSATVPLATTITPTAMGHPRDMCHSVDSSVAGACSGPIGDGNWDRDAYFRTNYRRADGTYWTNAEWQANTLLPATATRAQVYDWEITRRDQTIDGVTILASAPTGATGATLMRHGKPVCSPTAGYGAGTVPTTEVADRRKITVAVVNCLQQSVNGASNNVQVKDWLEVLMVEPSLNRARTSDGDAYVEVIRSIGVATGSTNVQVVHKAIPYLIE